MKLFASVLWQLCHRYCKYNFRSWVILTGAGNSFIKICMCTHMQLHTCTFHSSYILRWEKWPGEKIPISLGEPHSGLLQERLLSPDDVTYSAWDSFILHEGTLSSKVVDTLACSFPRVILLSKGNPVAWFPMTEIIKPRICYYLSQFLLIFSQSSKCHIQCSI